MRHIIKADESRPLTICFGRVAENIVTEIGFDLTDWIAEYGTGTASIRIQSPLASSADDVATSMDGNIAYHALTSSDLYAAGEGRVQLVYTVGTKIKKSRIFNTKILESLTSFS